MISETISLVKTALNNPTYGVNVYLNSGSLPAVAGVYTETNDYWITVGGSATNYPIILISLSDNVDFIMPEVRTSIRDVNIPISVTYWNKIVDTEIGIDYSYKTLACVMQSLRQWSKNENAAARIDNNIQIIEMVSITQTPRVVNQDQDVNLVSSLNIVFRVRDTNP